MVPYTQPTFGASAFNCPSCGAYANQNWFRLYYGSASVTEIGDLRYCSCAHCSKYSVWRNEKMILPSVGTVVKPNPDLPEDIKTDYEEAREIINKSPRGAAALLEWQFRSYVFI